MTGWMTSTPEGAMKRDYAEQDWAQRDPRTLAASLTEALFLVVLFVGALLLWP